MNIDTFVLVSLKSYDYVTYKHLRGQHNQKRHGWRYGAGNARNSQRGQGFEERQEYRKRAGLKPLKEPKPKPAKEAGTKETKMKKPFTEAVKKNTKDGESTKWKDTDKKTGVQTRTKRKGNSVYVSARTKGGTGRTIGVFDIVSGIFRYTVGFAKIALMGLAIAAALV